MAFVLLQKPETHRSNDGATLAQLEEIWHLYEGANPPLTDEQFDQILEATQSANPDVCKFGMNLTEHANLFQLPLAYAAVSRHVNHPDVSIRLIARMEERLLRKRGKQNRIALPMVALR